jgi:hypothetical protein
MLGTLQLPSTVVFWRPANETICKHRCPLWDDAIGLSPRRTIALDLLHSLYLGPMQSWCKMPAWLLLTSPSWGLFEASESERHASGIMSMRAELMGWYDRWGREHPDEPLTRLTNLTANMLGEKGERKLKAKAMETWGLLLLFLDMVRKYAAQIGASAAVVLECVDCLERYARLCKREGVNVSVATQQERVRGQFRYSLSTLASTRLPRRGAEHTEPNANARLARKWWPSGPATWSWRRPWIYSSLSTI